jgi:hypothetical protein
MMGGGQQGGTQGGSQQGGSMLDNPLAKVAMGGHSGDGDEEDDGRR